MPVPSPHIPEVTTAKVDVRYGAEHRMWFPMIIVRLQPPTQDLWPVLEPTLRYLRDAGWTRPDPLLRGMHINSVARATIHALTLDGPVTISGGDLRLYEGPLHRSAGWSAAAREIGTVLVVVTTLDDDESAHARDGEVLAAPGVLLRRNPSTSDSVLPTSPQGD